MKERTRKFRRSYVILLLALICAFLISMTSSAATVGLNKTHISLKTGKTCMLKLKNNKAMVKWKSSNKNVVTVNGKGKVKAQKPGKAIITATVRGQKFKYKVTVIGLSKSSLTLNVGGVSKLKLKNSSGKVRWSTSDPRIAVVNSKGKVTAKAAGTVQIKAKASGKTYTCKVTVTVRSSVGSNLSAGNGGGSSNMTAGNGGSGSSNQTAGNGGSGSSDPSMGSGGSGSSDPTTGSGGSGSSDSSAGSGSSDPSTGSGSTGGTDMPSEDNTVPEIKYQAYVRGSSWQGQVSDGQTAGTVNQSLPVDGLKITLTDTSGASMITYRAHVSNTGWEDWKTSGAQAGAVGANRAIEAVAINLTGAYASRYDVYYRAHVSYRGWLGWAKNGETAGTINVAVPMEAIEIKLVRKGTVVDGDKASYLQKPELTYNAYVQNQEWLGDVDEGETAGTTGKQLRLEALKINLTDFDGNGGIEYTAYLSNYGWQGWKKAGAMSGTTGESRAIEAVQIRLTKSLAPFYDVYYRVHSSGKGWLGWAMNEEPAGVIGQGIPAEAIEIKLLHKRDVGSFDRGGSACIQGIDHEIKLQHYMTSSMKQPYRGPCAAYSYAIGLSIILKQNFDPMRFYNGVSLDYTIGYLGNYEQTFNAAKVYEALLDGRPVMFHYTYPGSQHWVLVMGVKKGAILSNLQYSDFICIDPYDGLEKPLTSAWAFASGTFAGMNIMTKY